MTVYVLRNRTFGRGGEILRPALTGAYEKV